MNEFENQLEKCKELLYQEPVVQEYFRLKRIVQNDKNLVRLDQEIHQHQHKMCIHKNDDEIYLKEKSLYDAKMNEFKSNPMVENYFQIREEVYELLSEIKEILE